MLINPFQQEESAMVAKSLKALLAVVVVLGLVSVAYAGTLDDIAQRGELRIACQTQGPPFSFVDKNGKRTGSSIELCEQMAKAMGVKVVFQDYDWDGLIPALLSKKTDMLAADMTPTLERAMKIAFSTPYLLSVHGQRGLHQGGRTDQEHRGLQEAGHQGGGASGFNR
jgi:ABC-type amino acid transport substrate-binding protein